MTNDGSRRSASRLVAGAFAVVLGAGVMISTTTAGATTRPPRTPRVTHTTKVKAAATPNLENSGGALLTHVKIVAVLYGAPAANDYAAEVTAKSAPNLASFYTSLASSPYMDLLSEYSSDNRAIRAGSFVRGPRPDGLFAITPAAADNGAVVDDASVQAELRAHVGVDLPPADADTFYVVYFRKSQTLTLQSARSDDPLGFCAYHDSIATPGGNIRYAAIPSSSSQSWCGKSVGFGNVTAVSSHELADAVTDPDPFTSWTNAGTTDEVADLCNQTQQSFKAPDKHTYMLQQAWSNQQQACVIAGPPRFVGVGDASVVEGDSGQRLVQIPITLTAPSRTALSVSYQLVGLGGGSGTIAFPASKKGTPIVEMITLAIPGDTTVEADEAFHVTIHTGDGYGVVRADGNGVVLDDDAETGQLISVGDASAMDAPLADGTIPVPITLSTPSSAGVSVRWAVTAGTGTMALLTGETHGVLKIPSHSTGAFINLTTKASKTLLGADQTLIVTLSSPSTGTQLGNASGVVTLFAP